MVFDAASIKYFSNGSVLGHIYVTMIQRLPSMSSLATAEMGSFCLSSISILYEMCIWLFATSNNTIENMPHT